MCVFRTLTSSTVLSVMSSLFDSWFGFILWGVAFFRMRAADTQVGHRQSPIVDWAGIVVNTLLILVGIFFPLRWNICQRSGHHRCIRCWSCCPGSEVFSYTSNAV
ncbi:hypothetical protein B0T10DRAFT_502127 [Thelonectria olida]|uniref:Uncharacterized protein n=1 Tax=Thelonectria olida TaxID=1576542 RepID=A0A9P8VP81_9HYPO|nr:hypothetical protein B0T10DRAFT_502127 [Thelonectria olida]